MLQIVGLNLFLCQPFNETILEICFENIFIAAPINFTIDCDIQSKFICCRHTKYNVPSKCFVKCDPNAKFWIKQKI